MSYEVTAEILNFGAFLAFMGVNLAVIWQFWVRRSDTHRRTFFTDVNSLFRILHRYLDRIGYACKDRWRYLVRGRGIRPRVAYSGFSAAIDVARPLQLRVKWWRSIDPAKTPFLTVTVFPRRTVERI